MTAETLAEYNKLPDYLVLFNKPKSFRRKRQQQLSVSKGCNLTICLQFFYLLFQHTSILKEKHISYC